MPEKKSRFVLVSRQLLAFGTVAALAAPAAGVISLDIVAPPASPSADTPGAPVASTVAVVASRPVEPEVTEVPLRGRSESAPRTAGRRAGADREGGKQLAALSDPEKVDGFVTVGVTWDEKVSDEDITVSVRSREDGAWSTWQTVEYHEEHGPTPGTPEARHARQGTDAIVVGDVDEVQVKVETVDGTLPADASLALVDPGDTPAPTVAAPAIDTADLPAEGAAALSSASVPAADDASDLAATTVAAEDPVVADGQPDGEGVLTGAVGVTPKPRIFSRAQWGADESLRTKSSLTYLEVHAGFIHHTVNANDYTSAQVPSILRGIYAYHTRTRGWSDIGYNFVVDRFGRIWEGRYGGVDRPVVGAHTLGYNEYAFAMAALGNFEQVRPSSAMVDAYGRLFAWKLSLHGVSAGSTAQRVGTRTFPAINGHRDAGSTACPGRYLYNRVGRIRTLATEYQAPFTARARTTDLAGTPWPDMVVRDAETKRVSVVRTGGQTNFQAPQAAASGWQGKDLVVAAGDLTGDKIPDFLAREATSKQTGVYPGTPQGAVGAPVRVVARFSTADEIVGSRDLTGDTRNDVVTRVGGNLWLYPGRGDGTFRRRVLLSADWDRYDLTAGVGDLDGDGDNDLVARSGRTLYLVPGVGRRIGEAVALSGRWGGFEVITGAGDLTLDGHADVVVKTRTSRRVFILPGDGTGQLGAPLGPFLQFRKVRHLGVAGQLAGDASSDLVGLDGSGRLLVFPHNGARNVEAVADSGLVLTGANLLLNVGDWNGDGFGDLMVRTGRGVLQLRLGDGQGHFGRATQVATGWNRVKLVAAVGDITGDGHPDLMGQPRDSAMRIYPGDGSAGLLASYVAHSPISSDRHTGLGLWNDDGSPDSLLRTSDGALVLYPGNGPGGLMNPKQVAQGARRYDWLQSVGDATGDGRPDLVARQRSDGTLWLLPGTRSGFGVRRLVADGFGAYDLSS